MSRTIKFAKRLEDRRFSSSLKSQVPAPGLNEVRIKVKAIGINRAEAMWAGRRLLRAGQVFSGKSRLRGCGHRRCCRQGREPFCGR